MEVTGKFYKIQDVQEITEKFKKKEFVLEMSTNPAYVEKVIFQLSQDRVDLIDSYKEGDEVKVHYNLKGREWTSPKGEVKFFNTLDVWKVEDVSSESNDNPQRNEEDLTKRVDLNENSSDDDDDLPF